jgi:hypothetical protein
MKTIFILFGQAGQNVAQNDPSFKTHLRRAFNHLYMTKEKASAKLMEYCLNESDYYTLNDEGTAVVDGGHTIMKQGDMSYDHDSRTWELIAIEDLDEKDAKIALRDDVFFDRDNKETIYKLHESLRPVEEED